MINREKFESWMTAEQWFHGSDFEWDESRNCYAQFGIHLAYKAFLAAEGAAEQKLTDLAVHLANAESKCRELAGELHSVKSAHQDAVDTIMNTASKGVVIYTEKPIQMSVATPIHDAFLAEVLASSIPDEATERDLFEEWVMENVYISKSTLEGLRTDGGYRNSTLSGKDYNGMWSQWKALRAAQLRKGAAL